MAYVNKAKVNPSSPIIYLKIGGTEITVSNSPRQAQNIISLSLTESAFDTYSDIVFTLFDESALVVEYEIKKGFNNVQYKFGMDETNLSPMRTCHIKDYDIEFTGGGMMLTLQCIDGPLDITGTSNDHEEPKVYKGKISEVVSQICKDLGYQEGNIVETDDDPNAKEEGYKTSGYDLVKYIEVELCPHAKSTKGTSGYTVYTTDKDGQTYLYFEPLLLDEVDEYQTYEFVIGQNHENIISFKPEYKGLLYTLVGGGSSSTTPTDSSTIDSNSAPVDTSLGDGVENQKMTRDVIDDGSGATGGSTNRDKPIQGEIISAMIGRDIYPKKGGQLKVYTGTNSKECDVVTTLKNQEWADIVAETASWYKVKTYLGKEGWVRKVDVSVGKPEANFEDKDGDHKEDKPSNDGFTTTNPDNYQTNTNWQSAASQAQKYDLGLLAPSVDELSNVIIKPYNSDSTFKRYVGSSSYNAEELGRIAEYMFTMASVLMPTAQLTIRGDAKICTKNFVIVIVMTKDKLFHHSSGLYQILEVQHDIEMGEYTTTLNMIKRAMQIDESGNITLLDSSEGVTADPGLGGSNPSDQGSNPGSGNDGSENISNNVVNSASSDTIRKYAEKYIGLPYVWGGSGPNKKGYDCSGFCSEMLYDMGYKRIGTTANFINTGQQVCPPWDKANILPGDCIVYRQNGAGHVVMVVDQNTVVHAPKTGDVIKYADIDYYWNYMQKKNGKIMRYIGNDQYKR